MAVVPAGVGLSVVPLLAVMEDLEGDGVDTVGIVTGFGLGVLVMGVGCGVLGCCEGGLKIARYGLEGSVIALEKVVGFGGTVVGDNGTMYGWEVARWMASSG